MRVDDLRNEKTPAADLADNVPTRFYSRNNLYLIVI